MNRIRLLVVSVLVLYGCANDSPSDRTVPAAYLDNSGRDDVLSGGVKMIPVETPKGTFKVWTKRIGNNPRIKVLLLHGGPGVTHEYLEAFDSYFPSAGIEYYYYDQLGSYYSDQPDEPELWDLPRFVESIHRQESCTNWSRLSLEWVRARRCLNPEPDTVGVAAS